MHFVNFSKDVACENSCLTSGGFFESRPMWGGCFRRLPKMCPPCLIIIQSCYFDYRIDRPFTWSLCVIAFHSLFTRSRCTTSAKDHGLFYLNYPQINGVVKTDDSFNNGRFVHLCQVESDRRLCECAFQNRNATRLKTCYQKGQEFTKVRWVTCTSYRAFSRDVIAAMLEGKNNAFSLLWEVRSIFMQNCFIVSALQHGCHENPLLLLLKFKVLKWSGRT